LNCAFFFSSISFPSKPPAKRTLTEATPSSPHIHYRHPDLYCSRLIIILASSMRYQVHISVRKRGLLTDIFRILRSQQDLPGWYLKTGLHCSFAHLFQLITRVILPRDVIRTTYSTKLKRRGCVTKHQSTSQIHNHKPAYGVTIKQLRGYQPLQWCPCSYSTQCLCNENQRITARYNKSNSPKRYPAKKGTLFEELSSICQIYYCCCCRHNHHQYKYYYYRHHYYQEPG
jgi:hypothetical protein